VDDHAVDAHHRGTAVVALGVQLELLAREAGHVGVAHPHLAGLAVGAVAHITRLLRTRSVGELVVSAGTTLRSGATESDSQRPTAASRSS